MNTPATCGKLRRDLLAYCKMDTLAMVKVLGVLEGCEAKGRQAPTIRKGWWSLKE
ncbi:MAG: hypothetical protein IPH60_15040 [Flavobacteriales bacterium]|nr:hypothetical protein [Flavobacteriales bacterium]